MNPLNVSLLFEWTILFLKNIMTLILIKLRFIYKTDVKSLINFYN
jgi:hypothetical protein